MAPSINDLNFGVTYMQDEMIGTITQQENTSTPSPKKRWHVIVVGLIVVVGVLASGIWTRVKARATLRTETDQMALPTVSVIQPERSAPAQDLVLPASVQPYINAPIFARTNGYLKRWYVDIGAHVKKGQLLAEIETPEVDQQLRQARANLATAQANLALSKITATRYRGLLASNAVAQQDADNATGAFNANRAIVQSNEANVSQLEQLQSFEKIYAPFDGVITIRNTDVGALITSGSSGGPSTELFQIAQPERLRVYVSVPEAYVVAARPGLTASLTFAAFPGRRFQGKLVRTAEAVDPVTRTLLVEIAVPNPSGTLYSGSYAEVHLNVPNSASTYIVPTNALLFRKEGLRVVTVKNNKAALLPITPGRDFGDRMEVVAGLSANEEIVVNPPDSIVEGESVRVVQDNAGGQK
jgi:RND family efflux transporter MFP subunit